MIPAGWLRAGSWRLAVVLVALLLAACGSGPAGAPAPDATAPAIPAPDELAAAKKAAGIADCPTSDAGVGTVDGGLPDVTLRCLGGGRDVRLAGLRGRPMMINIWAQWCEPCRAEARFLAEAADQLGDKIRILGIDYNDPRPDYAIEFAAYAKWRYPQLVDPDLNLRAPLQVAGPPQTLLVDARGKVVYRHSGPFTSTAQITAAVEKHLEVAP